MLKCSTKIFSERVRNNLHLGFLRVLETGHSTLSRLMMSGSE